jgi:hypothetical protein
MKSTRAEANGCNWFVELRTVHGITPGRGTGLACVAMRAEGPIDCLLRSLPGSLAEIPERFSSSSLPPSFAQGRCVAFLLPQALPPRSAFLLPEPAAR